MKGWLVLFLQSVGVLFVGIALCNVLDVLIRCMFNGFELFLSQVSTFRICYILSAR